MLELHRPDAPDPLSDELEERIGDMVIACKIHRYGDPGDHSLPYFKENQRITSEPDAMHALLDEIGRQVEIERNLSGDECYIDPRSGESC